VGEIELSISGHAVIQLNIAIIMLANVWHTCVPSNLGQQQQQQQQQSSKIGWDT